MSSQKLETGKGHNRLRIVTVTTQQQLIEAFVVRGICFIHEQSMKTSLIFDGNDTQATHILLYDEDEPIGTARLRWFRDFAKMERTCIRAEWRDPRTLKACAEFVFDLVARKGYDRIITFANPTYAAMWRRILGFRPVEGKPPFHYEGHDEPYIEMERRLDHIDDAITAESEASLMFRIEGRWDEPLQFEASGV